MPMSPEPQLEEDELSAVEIDTYSIREDMVQIWRGTEAPEPLLDLFHLSVAEKTQYLVFIPATLAAATATFGHNPDDVFWCGQFILEVVEGEGGEWILAL